VALARVPPPSCVMLSEQKTPQERAVTFPPHSRPRRKEVLTGAFGDSYVPWVTPL